MFKMEDDETAIAKVFSTVELLEQILLNLEPRDLLRANSVHSHFRNTITRSLAAQKKLFFETDPDVPLGQPKLNPLLSALFPVLFSLDRPLDEMDLLRLRELHQEPWYKDPDWRARVLDSEASWRKMFPVQPPAKLGMINIHSECCFSKPGCRAELGAKYQDLQKNGMKMGLLFDIILHMESIKDRKSPQFFVHWCMLPLVLGKYERAQDPDWVVGDFGDDLFPDYQDLKHEINLYHCFEPFGCGSVVVNSSVSGLQIDSPITRSIEKDLRALLWFPDRVAAENSGGWEDYLPEKEQKPAKEQKSVSERKQKAKMEKVAMRSMRPLNGTQDR